MLVLEPKYPEDSWCKKCIATDGDIPIFPFLGDSIYQRITQNLRSKKTGRWTALVAKLAAQHHEFFESIRYPHFGRLVCQICWTLVPLFQFLVAILVAE